MEEEACLAFVSMLKPYLIGHVRAHTRGDLSIVQAMAERLDHYTCSTKGDACPSGGSGNTGGRSSGRGTRGGAAQKNGQLNVMEKKPADTGSIWRWKERLGKGTRQRQRKWPVHCEVLVLQWATSFAAM